MDKGIFITFEGLDGSGKSTQIDILYRSLKDRSYDVLKTVEPGGTELGQRIRELLLHNSQFDMDPRTETLLFLASRAELSEKVIRPALAEGKVVISDRFSDSTVVYQGIARGLGMESIMDLNSWATKTLVPDITFILDIEPRECEKRDLRANKSKDRIESEEMDFKHKIHLGYRDIAEKYKERVMLLDGTADVGTLSRTIFKRVLEALDESA